MLRRAYTLTHRIERWFQWRFTPAGRVLCGALVAVGLFALNPRAASAWQLAVLMMGILVGSAIWAPLFRPRVRIERELPRFVTNGTPCSYRVRIENLGKRALVGLSLGEWSAVRRELVPRGTRGGYLGFVRAMRTAIGHHARLSSVPTSSAGEIVRVELTTTPLRRGYIELPQLVLMKPDPLGLVNGFHRCPNAERVIALPARHRIAIRDGGRAASSSSESLRTSERTGSGLDFARLREYRPGDALRHVDWRAFARIGEPVVKEFHDDAPSRSALLLDTAPPEAASSEQFESAVSVAASFAADRSWLRGRVDLLFAGGKLVTAARGCEGDAVVRILEALALVQPGPDHQFVDTGRLIRRNLGQFAHAVCVMLSIDAPRQRLLDVMANAGCELTVVLVHAAGEPPPHLGDGLRVVPIAAGEEAAALASLDRVHTRQSRVGHG